MVILEHDKKTFKGDCIRVLEGCTNYCSVLRDSLSPHYHDEGLT